MKHFNLLAISMMMALSLSACDPPSNLGKTQLEKQREAASLQAAAAQTECNECDNIAFKRTTLGKPGLIGYVVFLSYDGRPIQYYTVKGKCTSGSKRLDPIEHVGEYGTNDAPALVPNVGDDGTYGSSGEYIYCRTTNDAYVQWNGQYLYQTQPFDLTIKPLVIDTSGKEQGQ